MERKFRAIRLAWLDLVMPLFVVGLGFLFWRTVVDSAWLLRVGESHIVLGGRRIFSGNQIYTEFSRSEGPIGFYLAALGYKFGFESGFIFLRLISVILTAVNVFIFLKILNQLRIPKVVALLLSLIVVIANPLWFNFHFQVDFLIQFILLLCLLMGSKNNSSQSPEKYFSFLGAGVALIIFLRVTPGLLMFIFSLVFVLRQPGEVLKKSLFFFLLAWTTVMGLLVLLFIPITEIGTVVQQTILKPLSVYWPYQFISDGFILDLLQVSLVFFLLLSPFQKTRAIATSIIVTVGLSLALLIYSVHRKWHYDWISSYIPWMILLGALFYSIRSTSTSSKTRRPLLFICILSMAMALPIYHNSLPGYAIYFSLLSWLFIATSRQPISINWLNSAKIFVLLTAFLQYQIPNAVLFFRQSPRHLNQDVQLYVPKSVDEEIQSAKQVVSEFPHGQRFLIAPLFPIFYLATEAKPFYVYDYFYPPYMRANGAADLVKFLIENPDVVFVVNRAKRFLAYKYPQYGHNEELALINTIPGLKEILELRERKEIGGFSVYFVKSSTSVK